MMAVNKIEKPSDKNLSILALYTGERSALQEWKPFRVSYEPFVLHEEEPGFGDGFGRERCSARDSSYGRGVERGFGREFRRQRVVRAPRQDDDTLESPGMRPAGGKVEDFGQEFYGRALGDEKACQT